MSKKSFSNLLTEVELEIMSILWKIKEGTARDVLNRLPEERKLAYTSVSTMIRILEQKEFVQSFKEGKSHLYSPLLQKEEYEERTINHMVNNVFEGTASNLVKRLVNDSNLSVSELYEIKSILDEL